MGNYLFVSRYNTREAMSDSIQPLDIDYQELYKALLGREEEIKGASIVYMDFFDICGPYVNMTEIKIDKLLKTQDTVFVIDIEKLFDEKSDNSHVNNRRTEVMNYLLDRYLRFGGNNLLVIGLKDEGWYSIESVYEYMDRFSMYKHMFIKTDKLKDKASKEYVIEACNPQ